MFMLVMETMYMHMVMLKFLMQMDVVDDVPE